MRVALVQDSFTQRGGAERVIDVLHEMYPEAPVFTLVLDRKLRDYYISWDIRTSWLQVIYNFVPKFQWLFPIVPLAVSSLNFEGYDLVISSSSGFAKNIKVPKNCVHINYCHTPTRFLWTDGDYVNQELTGLLTVFRPLAKLTIKLLKNWDYKGAQRVTKFIANSAEVKKRIKKYYNRDSEIIYPPVNVDFWKNTASKQDYFLLGGRLQAHKHNDLIIEIFNELNLPLRVFGTGRQEKYLKSIAKSNIAFLGKISDEQLKKEYSGASGFIYPQLEDFGLMPLEASACGTATIALGKGGALETVVPGVTGELFENYDKEKIKQIILSWNPKKYLANKLREHSEKFGKQMFTEKISNFINENRD